MNTDFDTTSAPSAAPGSDRPAGTDDRALRGPSWPTVAYGLICLAIAGGLLAIHLTDWQIDWRQAGPVSLVGLGGLLILVGLVGVLTRRRT